ncbi:DUF6491 family protein [Marinicella sp. S1101]|uniref:DUF6491 family protein n=1 Tax=Marinicella marina TaxID=2996016 RepID=UPI002260DCC7|nr:DUF6491 family protein [Marinicella marina]MCX7552393.1 DUF6491 family protein [Marinicella marina]MDJ1139268.1 DUF6491 family protein [Marinicella marina]
MKQLIILMLIMGLVGCNQNKHARVNYAEFIAQNNLQPQRDVSQFRFQGWQPLSDRFLILRSNQQKSYLIQLMSPCVDLPFANNIVLKQDMSNRLQAKFDSVVVPGQFRQSCRIDSIYEMDRELKQDLLEFGQRKEQIRVNN